MSRLEIQLVLLLWVGGNLVLDLSSWCYLHGGELLESLGCLSPVAVPVEHDHYFLDVFEGAFAGEPFTPYQPLAEPAWLRHLTGPGEDH